MTVLGGEAVSDQLSDELGTPVNEATHGSIFETRIQGYLAHKKLPPSRTLL